MPTQNTDSSKNTVMSAAMRKINFSVVIRLVFILALTFFIFIFSLFMSELASSRYRIYMQNYSSVTNIYSGEVLQKAPSLSAIQLEGITSLNKKYADEALPVPQSIQRLYEESSTNEVNFQQITKHYAENTSLIATTGNVVIDADFVKKGLSYQPSFKTSFKATYTLENTLDEASVVTFAFPFPVNINTGEISNAVLRVNGEEIKNVKAKIDLEGNLVDGLKWDGEIPANDQITVEVSYNTVGLDRFQYQGFENPKGSQDFTFDVLINGTRSYDVVAGLSVDKREFGENSVKLVWNKQSLYSTPSIDVKVGHRLNPSIQVARVYRIMTPLYFIFMVILLFLAEKFKKTFNYMDILLITILFVVYFPLLHYLSSFTIDPTMELFANVADVGYFSMPLYGAFAIAWVLIGTILYYLMGRMSGFGYTSKYICPLIILFLGFFPLVITIPEYSMLLVLLGVVGFMSIIVQIRINWRNKV